MTQHSPASLRPHAHGSGVREPGQPGGQTAGTQALGFVLCRHLLRMPPVAALSPAEAVAWLAPTFQRYLTGAQ
ncbi:hypothetical protein [Actinomadura flavalba]|uniref:TetR/AcrR family transcriptional regulator n=1 Tax=Actinomadura flavalba TaxID=1120938 RepID=UPI0012DFA7CE|nr:hypothetical protein [Actinomadura flavalba]